MNDEFLFEKAFSEGYDYAMRMFSDETDERNKALWRAAGITGAAGGLGYTGYAIHKGVKDSIELDKKHRMGDVFDYITKSKAERDLYEADVKELAKKTGKRTRIGMAIAAGVPLATIVGYNVQKGTRRRD